MLIFLIAQAAPQSSDPVSAAIIAVGSGGSVGLVLWTILNRREAQHEKAEQAWTEERRELTDRLFALADTSTKVAHGAAEVVREDAATPDPRIGVELARISEQLQALRDDRGRP